MQQQKDNKWFLVRNNNGEWICSDQVVYLDDITSMIYRSRAIKYDLPLSPQVDYNGEEWYYQHQIGAITSAMEADKQEIKLRQIKIAAVRQNTDKHKTKEP